jgi:hypothetical protein
LQESEKMLKKLQGTHTQLSLDNFQISEPLARVEMPSLLDQKIKQLHIDNMTPLEALSTLKELQDGLK